ncbi:DUF2716 domain-containing protein [Embleya sp. MST-111070]|uniref:DUF2716 domain-containing protein n=1 Tax=Embleya sp. MST-111070 TaxID=3398231 RepID=UPI003F7369D0
MSQGLRRPRDAIENSLWRAVCSCVGTLLAAPGVPNRFDARFAFRAGVCEFPGITEPSPSITWSPDALREDPGGRNLDRPVDVVQDGLADRCGPGEWLWLLDRQHTCHRLRPDVPESTCSCRGCSRGARARAGRSAPSRTGSVGADVSAVALSRRAGLVRHDLEHERIGTGPALTAVGRTPACAVPTPCSRSGVRARRQIV